MPKKTYTPEQIVTNLHEIEVLTNQGTSIPAACKQAGVSDVSYYRWRKEYGGLKNECLNQEIFYSLKEARIVIEQWRYHYNHHRPHSALGYRPPAPLTVMPKRNPVLQSPVMQ